MNKKIIILYYSKGGNTKELANKIYTVLQSELTADISVELTADISVELTADISVELKAADSFLTDPSSIDDLRKVSGLIVGTPDYYSYLSGFVKIFFDEIYSFRRDLTDVPAFGFITHGGGGRAAKPLQGLLSSIKLNVISPIISVQSNNITEEVESDITNSCKKMIEIIKSS
jgi:flavorubredoxin